MEVVAEIDMVSRTKIVKDLSKDKILFSSTL